MAKGNFLFYESFVEMFELMPTDADKVEFIRALYQYGLYKHEVETSSLVAIALAGAKPNIDAANKRYEANVENGKKGGRPKKSETQQNPTEPTETQQNPTEPNVTENNPTEPTRNHNVNVNADVNVDADENIFSETSSPDKLKKSSPIESLSKNNNINKSAPAPQAQPAKRISLKDQLINYVNELDYTEETKKALFDWIFQIGLNGKVSVKQLQDKLEYIWNIYDDESLVRESINEAYRNNWFGFFPVKNIGKNSPVIQEKNRPNSNTNTHQDKIYNETNKPAQTMQQGCWNMTR